MKAIIIEGSSTAEGYGGGTNGAWVKQVDRMLPGYDVHNLARAGMSLSGINRVWETQRMAHRFRDSGILRILAVGQNEARINPDTKRPIVTLDRFAEQLTDFSQATRAANLALLYVGPQLVDESKCTPVAATGWFIENDLIEEYAAVIRAQAQNDGAPYVDVTADYLRNDHVSLLDEDGRHPNEVGHGVIASGVLRALGGLGIDNPAAHQFI